METSDQHLLIVGAGHAGSELAVSARQNGWAGRITLLGDEPALPYHRPPLSKAWLAGKVDEDGLLLRPRSAYETARVELVSGARMEAIDRTNRRIVLADGTSMAYDKLALCTGGRPRPLCCAGLAPGARPRNLHYLRTMADAEGIRAQLSPGARVLIIGGGYVGLEVAASARGLGAEVTLLELQDRVLARVAGPEVSAFYEGVHRAAGVDLRTGTEVASVEVDGDAIRAVVCRDGTRLPVDLVVAGLGMLVNVEAARAAGIAEEAASRSTNSRARAIRTSWPPAIAPCSSTAYTAASCASNRCRTRWSRRARRARGWVANPSRTARSPGSGPISTD